MEHLLPPIVMVGLLTGLSALHLLGMRKPQAKARINAILHALMALSMAAMAASSEVPVLPQLILFASATLWFVIQAASRPQLNLCTTPGERIKCLYHAGSMAAVTLMLIPTSNIVPEMPDTTHHHGHAMAQSLHGPLTIPPTAYEVGAAMFLIAGTVFTVLAIRATIAHIRSRGGRAARTPPQRILGPAAEAASALLMMAMMMPL